MSFLVPTLTEILDELLDRCPKLGMKITLAAVNNGAATATTTDSRLMSGGTNTTPAENARSHLWVPGLTTADDRIRSIVGPASGSPVSATVFTFTVNRVYAAGDTNETAYVIGMKPDTLVDLINDALRKEPFVATVPLTEPVDGDMQTSGVGSWTDSNSTSSKVTAAANVPFELTQALRVLNSGANGRTRPALVRIPTGKSHYVWAIGRADVGTAVLRIADASDTEIATISTTEEDFMFLWAQVTPGATVEGLYLEPGGSGASDDTYWGGVGLLREGARNFLLPSWMADRWQFRSLSIARFPVNQGSGVEVAASRQLERLTEGEDFRLTFAEAGANPGWIELDPAYTGYPLFLTGWRSFGDIDTLSVSDLTTTTRCNLNLAVARSMHLLAEAYPTEYGRYYNQGIVEADAIRRGQVTDLPKRQVERFIFGVPN